MRSAVVWILFSSFRAREDSSSKSSRKRGRLINRIWTVWQTTLLGSHGLSYCFRSDSHGLAIFFGSPAGTKWIRCWVRQIDVSWLKGFNVPIALYVSWDRDSIVHSTCLSYLQSPVYRSSWTFLTSLKCNPKTATRAPIKSLRQQKQIRPKLVNNHKTTRTIWPRFGFFSVSAGDFRDSQMVKKQ